MILRNAIWDVAGQSITATPVGVKPESTPHVTLEVESIDRMYLNVYQPRLQFDRGVVSYFRFHRGHTFASSALMKPISNAFIADVERFIQQQEAAVGR